MPTWPATARAARSLSPVSRTGRRPRPRRRATAAAAAGRSWSARRRGAGLAVPAGQDRGPAVVSRRVHGRAQPGGHVDGQLGEQLGAAHGDVAVPDAAAHPGPRQRGEPGDRRQAAEPGGGLAGDGLADGVLGAVLDRPGQQQRLLLGGVLGAVSTAVTVMVPVVRVPVLSRTTTRIRGPARARGRS